MCLSNRSLGTVATEPEEGFKFSDLGGLFKTTGFWCAKRQITWFKRRQDAVHIIFDDDRNAAVKTVIDKCEDFLNG